MRGAARGFTEKMSQAGAGSEKSKHKIINYLDEENVLPQDATRLSRGHSSFGTVTRFSKFARATGPLVTGVVRSTESKPWSQKSNQSGH